MGDVIKILSKGKVFHTDFVIELNRSPLNGQDQQIHIQSSNFRFEMNKKDYIKYALCILVAEKNLKNLKGIE